MLDYNVNVLRLGPGQGDVVMDTILEMLNCPLKVNVSFILILKKIIVDKMFHFVFDFVCVNSVFHLVYPGDRYRFDRVYM